MSKFKTLKSIGIKGLYWVVIAWFLFVYYRITKNTQVDLLLHQVASHSPTAEVAQQQNSHGTSQTDNHTINEALRINQSVVIAANHHVVLTNCLLNCLVLNAMLNYKNIKNNMIVGIKHDKLDTSTHINVHDYSNENARRYVSDDGRSLAGHMWVEINGVVINDSFDNISQYQRVDQFSIH